MPAWQLEKSFSGCCRVSVVWLLGVVGFMGASSGSRQTLHGLAHGCQHRGATGLAALTHIMKSRRPAGAATIAAMTSRRASPPRNTDASGRRTAGAPHEVRIIGGLWRRTRLPVADAPGLRPTPGAAA